MNWLREADAEPLPGYRLIRPLGTGGFGEVWLCEAPGGIHKAIKFVYGNLHADDGGNLRAEQEYRALQKVKEVRHPFVVTIERIDNIDGELIIVMELAEKNLHDLLIEFQDSGRVGIPRELLVGYMSDAAEGLDYLIERHNLLHLDVKPRNLFLVGNHVKVADFGLVKNLERHSSSGLMGGMSPMYAAAETFTGQISKYSDQYSLAIVYMELLTGLRPFNARTIRQLALQHMSEDPDLRPLPERDRQAVARALAKDPAKRFPNCISFVRALGGAVGRKEVIGELDLPTSVPASPRPSDPAEHTPPTAPRAKNDEPATATKPAADIDSQLLFVTQVQAEIGILRPTIFVGLGNFGLLALKELRRRLLDRVGDLTQTPSFRFLYVDSDPEAPTAATQGTQDSDLREDQVFLIRLQPFSNYRRRILDHLYEWLPREKLHAIPRSLQTQGERALGRLAFCDNYLRFDTRFSREVQVATHPESVAQTMTQSGLALRDNCPRICVIASAAGGSSGMLPDLGYTLRRRLERMQLPKSSVTLFLCCGAPHDPSTPKSELANVAAALTEVNHFHDPAIAFSAQYGGPDGPKIVDRELPFTSIYVMEQSSRTPQAATECAAHLAAYLVQDVTSPLGADLDLQRQIEPPPGTTPFRSFGAAGIWFPRGLMLRAAARLMCQRLLLEWQDPGPLHRHRPVDELCAKMEATRALQTEAITARLETAARHGDKSLLQSLASLLTDLGTDLPTEADAAAARARKALEGVVHWLGSPEEQSMSGSYLMSRITRSLNQAVLDLANEFTAKLNEYATSMLELPGKRMAAAESALQRMSEYFGLRANEVSRELPELTQKLKQLWAGVRSSLEACVAGSGFSFFGQRGPRNLRALLNELGEYGRARINEQLAGATARFFRAVNNGLEDRLRDLTFCRQRLSFLEQVFEPTTSGSHSGSHPGLLPPAPSNAQLAPTISQGGDQVLLPFGENDLDWAAARFVLNITTEQWTRLEEVLQSLVLGPLGGLHAICQKAGDLVAQLAGPLIDQTAAYLGNILKFSDIATGDFVAGGKRSNLVSLIQASWTRAQPLLHGDAKHESGYVVLPATQAGLELVEEIGKVMPGAKALHAPGQTSEIMVCREQGHLTLADLQQVFSHCREAYRELAARTATSPHARFDVLEWIPLDA
jgi:serine/threonine protein kinase